MTTRTTGIDEFGNTNPHINSYTYDAMGNMLTSSDANGNIVKNECDMRNNLIRREQANDTERIVSAYSYDLKNRLIYEVTPENFDVTKALLNQMNHTETIYDGMNRVILKRHRYRENAEDENFTGQVVEGYLYDLSGNAVKKVTGEGYATATGANHREKLVNAYGTEYTYDGNNRVTTELDPESKVRGMSYTVHYAYDGAGRAIEEIRAGGDGTAKYCYLYDSNGNITNKVLDDNGSYIHIESATYNRMGSAVTSTDGNNNTVDFTYNSIGMLYSEEYPGDSSVDAYSVTYKYDIVGRVVTETDSAGHITAYTYDRQGNMLTEASKSAAGTDIITVTKAYDKLGNLRFETDGNGYTTEYIYDNLSRNTAAIITVGGKKQIICKAYDKNGNIVRETDKFGNITETSYDTLGRAVSIKNALGDITHKMEYNKNNVQTKQYILNGEGTGYTLTEYEFDKTDRQVKAIDPLGGFEARSYNLKGLLNSVTDKNGNTTEYTYDKLDRLKAVTNALGETTAYTYDGNGNILTQTDGRGYTTSTEYNARNLPIRRIDHGGKIAENNYDPTKTETYTYYVNGLLHTKTTKNGDTVTYTYDIHGRNISESVGEITTTRTYDENGNELTMQDVTGLTSRAYDELNRTISKAVPNIEGVTYFEYDIDAGGGRQGEKTTDPKGNITVKEFDKLGRLDKVRDSSNAGATVYEYDGVGRRARVTYPNGAEEKYTYDNNNRLLTLKNYQDDILKDSYTYTYDADGNMLTKAEIVNGQNKGVTHYGYDELSRLDYATEGDNAYREYTYDAAGNRASEKIVDIAQSTEQTYTYTYNEQNRLTSISASSGGTQTFGYDYNGNIATNDNGSYDYDELNRLVSYTSSVSETTTYEYNGDGQRVTKTAHNGAVTKYLYEADKVIAEETDGEYVRNIYGINLISRNIEVSQDQIIDEHHSFSVSYPDTVYYQYNGLADVTRLSDTAGTQLATYEYDAFGNITAQSGELHNPFRFRGYQYDDESELYYLNARYYDARIARFMSEDTYRGEPNDPLSLNLYTYCSNNPIRYWDPTGHEGQVVFLTHGLGSDNDTFEETVANLKNESSTETPNGKKYISLGVVTEGRAGTETEKSGIYYNAEYLNELENTFGEAALKNPDKYLTQMIDKLTSENYNILVRTEFSKGNLSFENQRKEMGNMVDQFGSFKADVTFIGHSMGGLASINYGIDYAEAHEDKQVNIITVSTPYHPNNYADNTSGKNDAKKDLGGKTDALEKLRQKWNDYKGSGGTVNLYAISVATESNIDKIEEQNKIINSNTSSEKQKNKARKKLKKLEAERDRVGDSIVDIQSQQGRDVNVKGKPGYGFDNVNVMDRIDNPGSGPAGPNFARRDHAYHHCQTPKLKKVAEQINSLIK